MADSIDISKVNLDGPWTLFWDMHSGGGQKEDAALIIIQAPKNEARVIFYNRFGHSADRVTCTCCGEDYVVNQEDILGQLVGFHLNWHWQDATGQDKGSYVEEPCHGKWDTQRGKNFCTLVDWLTDPEHIINNAGGKGNCWIILRNEIKVRETIGRVPRQGYVWVDEEE